MKKGIVARMAGLMTILFCVSCEPNELPEGPLNDGSGIRSQIVVISDIHLGADRAYAEFNQNTKALCSFLDLVRQSPTVKELVIAGDMLDEWFVPATTDTYAGKDQADFVRRISAANSDVIEAFNRIIREKNVQVTYVPGNHDLTITAANVESILPGIHQAREAVQGLGRYSPEGYPTIAIEHGHRLNIFCAPDPISNKNLAPGSILPPGYFYTRIATLHVVQKCHTPGDSIKTITPNSDGGESQTLAYVYWNVWKTLLKSLPIENKFSENIIVTNIDGFTDTYSVNDVLPFQNTPGGPIDMKLYQGMFDTWDERQTLNSVPIHIPAQQALMEAASDTATDAMAIRQYIENPASDYRLVIFGHTHVARLIATQNHAGLKSLYANSGTWIDNNPKLTNMNFLVIRPQKNDDTSETQVKVYNYMNETITEMASDSLRL